MSREKIAHGTYKGISYSFRVIDMTKEEGSSFMTIAKRPFSSCSVGWNLGYRRDEDNARRDQKKAIEKHLDKKHKDELKN